MQHLMFLHHNQQFNEVASLDFKEVCEEVLARKASSPCIKEKS